jgi:hypothetical protein
MVGGLVDDTLVRRLSLNGMDAYIEYRVTKAQKYE